MPLKRNISMPLINNLFWINGFGYKYSEVFNFESPVNTFSFSNISILEYCDSIGVDIPHYCYHKNLSIAGNCRMCLIEMSKSPKPVVSCSLNAQSSFAGNNKIYTNSPLVKKTRENIMEFLLLNHPLDCPICDQGGECDLQDQSLFFGLASKRFYQQKRFVHNKHLGIIVKTVMSRCIHCTRCVRFATEVVGVEDLGVFGRGVTSEIGTYIIQLFDSEFSGNLIDICPVGALTSKPYPFLYRDWELKKVKTIDFSDGFGTSLLVYLKDNNIVKVLPGCPTEDPFNNTQWITDKTRFLFDGLIPTLNTQQETSCDWHNILKRIIVNIYVLDHLISHNIVLNSFMFLIDEYTSLETLSILLLLKRRYPFFKIKRPVKSVSNLDLDFFIKTNQVNDIRSLSRANACLLVGTNIRNESPYLYLKLNKRNSLGNFQTFSIGSKIDLTFPNLNIGSNIKKFTDLCEGNASSGILFNSMHKVFSLINTETCQRLNSYSLFYLFKDFNRRNSSKNWHSFNLLNTSLNALGLSYFQKIKHISIQDLFKTSGLFVVGNCIKSYSVIESYAEHLVLSHVLNHKRANNVPTLLIEQTSTYHQLPPHLMFCNYYRLISSSFFETSASFITTQGTPKSVVKFINPNNSSKEDWQIIRKVFSLLSKMSFVSSLNTRVSYNLKTMFQFRSYINFMHKASQTLTDLTFFINSFSQTFVFHTPFLLKTSFYLTQLKMWLRDFYIGGFDLYSRNSKLMINSSINLRKRKVTFSSTQ
jgi:NADH-ubiquinone oxidoreductase-G iron-sulfur binding region/2Fe-2S iron-sulfur cluster binding domain